MLSKRILPGRGIQPDRNEQHDGKSHERRTTVADQRQGNSHHRHQSDGHPHINEQMKKQECRNAVTVDPSERLLLPFAHTHQPEYQQAKERQQKALPIEYRVDANNQFIEELKKTYGQDYVKLRV
mgnify:FL=1